MPWSFVRPRIVYRVPVSAEALRARVLVEATRLRDAFPTRSFRVRSAKPYMLVAYTDGFDLLQFPQGQQPFGWLAIQVEPVGAICRLHVARRARPRPERFALFLLPIVAAAMVVIAARSNDPSAFLAALFPLAIVVFVFGILLLSERRQERRLLDLLASMFPGLTEEAPYPLGLPS
jgi:hypothetical protein